jgi:hypothetical protein
MIQWDDIIKHDKTIIIKEDILYQAIILRKVCREKNL